MIVKGASILFLGGILILGLMVLPVSVHGSTYVATHEESGILGDTYIEFTSNGDFTDYELDSPTNTGEPSLPSPDTNTPSEESLSIPSTGSLSTVI